MSSNRYKPLQNAGMGQGTAAASGGKVPSLWDGHHATGPGPAAHASTTTAARVTASPRLGTPGCPHGYRYRAIVWPTSRTLEVQGWTSRLSPSACKCPHLIPARDVAGAQGCHQPGPGSLRGGSGQGLGSSSAGLGAGPGAGLGTRSCAASAAARSCAHLDFSRLRSTSLLNQMAKINK